MQNQINLADYIEIENENTQIKKCYIRKPEKGNEFLFYCKMHPTYDITGKRTKFVFLPGYKKNIADISSVIYIGEDAAYWDRLLESYVKFKMHGTSFTYHVYKPCIGDTIIVSQEKYEEKIMSLGEAFEKGFPIPKSMEKLEEEYFLEAYKGLETEDEYFNLLRKAGITNVVKIAQNNGHGKIAKILNSWINLGMTIDESRNLGSNFVKSKYYNKTYFWNGVVVCDESYGINSPRSKTIYFITAEEISAVREQEFYENEARKEARKIRFQELSKTVTEKYGEEVLNIILRKKGNILDILKALSECKVTIEMSEMKKILNLTNNGETIVNLMAVVKSKIEASKAAKIAEKAHAWSYLNNALPSVGFSGYFDNAISALSIYSKNWGDPDGPMANALRNAGLV